jgi:N6-L-threonylcarbamoyladenine synthase
LIFLLWIYMKILAIETSCDETAASVVEKNGKDIRILSNVVASQIDIHKEFGGVFPEIASRAHSEKIIPVVVQALACCPDPDVLAVTAGPGLIGSLLIGVNFAKTYAYTKKLPIIPINHLLGHLYSNWATKPHPQFPAVILIVSGGHTGLYLMKSHSDIKCLGETLDDAAGEAFDKVAKLLDLGYPGGPAIAEAALKAISHNQCGRVDIVKISLPRPMMNSKDYNFSFSGLKTAVLYKFKELSKTYTLNAIRYSLASEFQQAVCDILVGKTIQAAREYHPKSICLCGGVSANKELREQLKKAVSKLPWKCSYHIPDFSLTTDNAAMIGIAAAYHLDQKTTFDNTNADANLKLN